MSRSAQSFKSTMNAPSSSVNASRTRSPPRNRARRGDADRLTEQHRHQKLGPARGFSANFQRAARVDGNLPLAPPSMNSIFEITEAGSPALASALVANCT